MRQCSNLPLYQYEGIKCNGSAKPFVNNTPTNNSCVNWNQYYTVCEASDKNPFQGAISFDNIGLAWVAIFQVGHRVFNRNDSYASHFRTVTLPMRNVTKKQKKHNICSGFGDL